MRYRHRFRVRAGQAAVAAFHARPDSMAAITPPPVIVRVHAAPELLRTGDEMAFTLWLGPVPVEWVAGIENASTAGFIDRQLHGPFARWSHRHSFRSLSRDMTEVRDEVEVDLRRHVLWGPIGLLMWLGLPLLFAYRSWKSKRILEGRS